jgi:hypothetical protein
MPLSITDKQLKILVAARKAIDEILEQRLEKQKLKPRSKKEKAFAEWDEMYSKLKPKKIS